MDLVGAVAEQVADLRVLPVGPSGEGHRPFVEEDLEPIPSRCHLSEVGDAEFLQVGLEDVLLGVGIESAQDGRVGDGGPAADAPAAADADLLAGHGAGGDGCVFRAAVGLGEFEGSGRRVGPAAQKDGDGSGGQLVGLLEPADLVARPLDGGERASGAQAAGWGPPRPLVVALRRDVEVQAGRAAAEHQCAGRQDGQEISHDGSP